MKIGLIADIHGNFMALERVLDELKQEQVEQILCLGDVASLGPQPHEALACLRELGCPVVLGNTDDWYLQSAPDDDDELREILRWELQQLTAADLEYLRSFQAVVEVTLEADTKLLCYHGSPRSYNEVIASTTPREELSRMLADYPASVMVGGHTHVQMLRRVEQAWFINPGSVGLPGVGPSSQHVLRNQDVHWAEYAILTFHNGQMSIDLRRTPLDLPRLIQVGYTSGMPFVDSWVKAWRSLEQG